MGGDGGARALAVKFSDVARPLLSVAVTLMFNVCGLAGAVPLKVSDAALKLSQADRARPFDSAALMLPDHPNTRR